MYRVLGGSRECLEVSFPLLQERWRYVSMATFVQQCLLMIVLPNICQSRFWVKVGFEGINVTVETAAMSRCAGTAEI